MSRNIIGAYYSEEGYISPLNYAIKTKKQYGWQLA